MNKFEAIKLIAETGSFVAAIVCFLKSRKFIAKDSHIISFLEEAAALTPKTITSSLAEDSFDKIKGSLWRVEEDELMIKFIGLIQGRVYSKNPLKSVIDKLKELVYSRLLIEPIYSNTSMSDPRDISVKTRQQNEFYLMDPIGTDRALIRGNSMVDYDDSLVTIGSLHEFASP